MKGPYREAIPLAARQVRVIPPHRKRAHKVQLLGSGKEPQTATVGGKLTVTVPSIRIHDVVAVDL
jgi:hypothetical protein